MPYFTPDLRTAINRAVLFMSVGESQACVILYSFAHQRYAVVEKSLFLTNHARYADLGYILAVKLPPTELQSLTGSIQLDLLEEDVYAVSQENL